jgi:hypothetical protein
MPCCLLLLLLLLSPRIVLVLMFFFSNYLERAYHGILIPLLGFIFLPFTTIMYAWLVNNGMPIAGFNLVLIVIAVIIDVGAHSGGVYHRYRN